MRVTPRQSHLWSRGLNNILLVGVVVLLLTTLIFAQNGDIDDLAINGGIGDVYGHSGEGSTNETTTQIITSRGDVARFDEITQIIKNHDSSLSRITGYIQKPEKWMLDLLSSLNANLIKRKYEYLKYKRAVVEILMFTDVVFSAIPSSPKRDEYVGHDNDDCAHKGLTGILAELMDKVKQTKFGLAHVITVMRKRLQHYFHNHLYWSEQSSVDLYTLFQVIGKENSTLNTVIAHVEDEWEDFFRLKVKEINSTCPLATTGAQVYDKIASIWPKVNKGDKEFDEEKLFKKYFPKDPPEIVEETKRKIAIIDRIEAGIQEESRELKANRSSADTSKERSKLDL